MNLPKHVAIIMDGNGRWAQSHGHPRTYGHIRGAQVAKKIITECAKQKISYLTLYTFSIENWKRPVQEVSFLMRLLLRHLRRERETLHKQNIRFQCIGNLSLLPEDIRKEIVETINYMKNNTGMVLTFALSYGSRQELLEVARKISLKVKEGTLNPEQISESEIEKHLDTAGMPDPDLVIRTSGEYRISNFLLWQLAYSELYFTDTFWPDFKTSDLHAAFESYQSRQRRFGGINNSTHS